MTIADKARDAAIHCEMKKVAYRQSKDGIVISFVLHPQEVPAQLSTSHIGARYIAALVEIGDDEQPIHPAEKESAPARPDQIAPKPDRAKRDWRDLPPAQQAGILCDQPIFSAYLKEQRPDDWSESPDPVDCVYLICGISSRAELGTNAKARVIWHQLDSAFQAWKALEHA